MTLFIVQVSAQGKTDPKAIADGVNEKSNVNSPASVTTEKIRRDIAEALAVIEGKHINGDHIDKNNLFNASIDSMLYTLDPHSSYLNSKAIEQFLLDQSSQYFGIGAIIGELRSIGGGRISTYIKATLDGAPANRAGLRYGDKILEVNGVSMPGKTSQEVSANLPSDCI